MKHRASVLIFFAVFTLALVLFNSSGILASNTKNHSIVAQININYPTYTPPTCTLGAPLNRPGSFDVDEFGRIYVIDYGRSVISVFAVDGTLETAWHNNDFGENKWVVRTFIDVVSSELIFLSGQSAANPFESQDVLRISPYESEGISKLPDGRFCGKVYGLPDREYVQMYNNDEIRFYTSNGDTLWSAPTGFANDHHYSPAGTDWAGNMHAYDTYLNTMHVWNRRGQKIAEFKPETQDIGTSTNSYFHAVVDSDGTIYADNNCKIFRMNARGKILSTIAPWVNPTEHPDNLYFSPHIFDIQVRNGIVYAMLSGDYGDTIKMQEIQAYTADGRCIARYLFPKPQYNCPNAIAVQPDASFAVGQSSTATDENGFMVSSDGVRLNPINTGGALSHVMAMPDSSYYTIDGFGFGKIDKSGNRIDKISTQNGLEITSKWPQLENRMVSAICPHPPSSGICLLTWHNVKDDNRTRCGDVEVRIIGSNGQLLQIIPFDDAVPESMTADIDGNIYIAYDFYYGKIIKFNSQGKEVYSNTNKGWELGQVDGPRALLTDNDGNLIVLDTGNSRIQIFDPDGKPLGIWGKLGKGDGQLNHPEAMCFGPNNTLWIADTRNDRIVTIPLQRLWKELTHKVTPPPTPMMLARRESLPKPGMVTLEGTVTADATDGEIYAQHATGSWGVHLKLPKGVSVARGKNYKITGKLETKNSENILVAKSIKPVKSKILRPLGLANAAIGVSGKNHEVPNGVLVATWGRVTSIDKKAKTLIVSDGSLGKKGIKVTCGKRIASSLPAKPGQYVAITGIATQDSLRIREASDIKNLESIRPAKQQVSMVR